MAHQEKQAHGGSLTRPAKGETMNPNGRPKKLPDLDKLLAEVLGEEKNGLTAAEAILIALRTKAAKGDIRAAEVLLDRAFGKARQTIDATIQQIPIQVVSTDPEIQDGLDKLG